MRFLEDAPKFLFFTGKGGVGKTSLACATALTLADRGKSVLLVSTDPASNVGQVFGVEIGSRITEIPGVERLLALEIDPKAAAAAYRERIVGPVRGSLPDSVVRGIEEQLSGACTTEIAAFDEFTALLTDESMLGRFDHIVFDTAPTGHTIRLLQLPGAWTGFLESAPEGSSCLGPLAGLAAQREQYEKSMAVLADGTRTRLVLVARPQIPALREAERTRNELAASGIGHQYLVINGCFPEGDASDPLARAILRRERAALDSLPEPLRALPHDVTTLLPFNLVGVDALRELLTPGTKTALALEHAPDVADPAGSGSLGDMIADLEGQGKGLILLMGKGGVGKTTLAAAIAVELAARGHQVHLTTTDPAAHLDAGLAQGLPRLEVSRIDPHTETERYRRHVIETKGQGLDAEGLALLEEDLRSPCTEEIAVFQAFSSVVRESRHAFVVIDTAPTGHTLLLLDATGAYHREVTRHLEVSGAQLTTPMTQLRDPEQTKVLIVTLAETTPVLEAALLQEDLGRAGIKPWGWIVNNSLVGQRLTSPLLAARAASESREIRIVRERHASRLAVIGMQEEEPESVAQLRALTCLTTERVPSASPVS